MITRWAVDHKESASAQPRAAAFGRFVWQPGSDKLPKQIHHPSELNGRHADGDADGTTVWAFRHADTDWVVSTGMSRVYRAETLRFCQARLPNRRFGEGSINVIRFYHFFSFILRVLLTLYLIPSPQGPDIVLQGPDIVLRHQSSGSWYCTSGSWHCTSSPVLRVLILYFRVLTLYFDTSPQGPDIVLQGPDIVPSASPQGPDMGSLRLYVRDMGSLRLYFAFQTVLSLPAGQSKLGGKVASKRARVAADWRQKVHEEILRWSWLNWPWNRVDQSLV